jgi:hypothetical protein
MMDENTEGVNTCGCGCGKMHHHGMGGKYWIAKKIVAIIILLVVFWFGTKLGELRTLMQYSRGSHMGMTMGMGGGYGGRMMMENGGAAAMPTTAPAAQ